MTLDIKKPLRMVGTHAPATFIGMRTTRGAWTHVMTEQIGKGEDGQPFVVTADGKSPSGLQIIENTPEPHTVWVNVYPGPPMHVAGHSTREFADAAWASNARIACVPLTYFDGEGLKK